MIAFEIEVDGKSHVTAGVEDWSVLSFHVTAVRGNPGSPNPEDGLSCRVGGVTRQDAEGISHHFRWKTVELSAGSKVAVRVVDVVTVDSPVKRYRSDADVQESSFTEEELREMRYQDYLALKAEFEIQG